MMILLPIDGEGPGATAARLAAFFNAAKTAVFVVVGSADDADAATLAPEADNQGNYLGVEGVTAVTVWLQSQPDALAEAQVQGNLAGLDNASIGFTVGTQRKLAWQISRASVQDLGAASVATDAWDAAVIQ